MNNAGGKKAKGGKEWGALARKIDGKRLRKKIRTKAINEGLKDINPR